MTHSDNGTPSAPTSNSSTNSSSMSKRLQARMGDPIDPTEWEKAHQEVIAREKAQAQKAGPTATPSND